jgi:hypothetical protein
MRPREYVSCWPLREIGARIGAHIVRQLELQRERAPAGRLERSSAEPRANACS